MCWSLPASCSLFLPFYFFPISNHLSVNTGALGNGSSFYLFLFLIKAYQNVVSPSLSLLCQTTKPSNPPMKDFLLLNILIRDNAQYSELLNRQGAGSSTPILDGKVFQFLFHLTNQAKGQYLARLAFVIGLLCPSF